MAKTNFQKLQVWNKSVDLIEFVYRITSKFPDSEIYWLVSQMRRASVSIASNIAEWDQRMSVRENVRFLYMAKWSAAEIQSQTMISYRLWFFEKDFFDSINNQIYEILKMLSSLIKYKIQAQSDPSKSI